MAEVGHRLGTGAYRLSALRNSQSWSVCTGESPGPLLVNSLSDSRCKEQSTRDQHREVQPVSRSKATRHKPEKLSGVTTSESPQENGTLRCVRYLELDSSRCIRERLNTHTTSLYLSARQQERSRGAVFIHPDTFRSGQGSDRWRRLKAHPNTMQVSTRSYCWRSDRSSEEAPTMYRARTTYYDILRVSPGATQSQIKTAYYKQSFLFHPDKNPGNDEATQRFSDISKAYTVLGNIGLRRKYDRGILSRSDVDSAGRPSSKETMSKSTAPPHQQHYRTRQFSQTGKKAMFDFDAFYQAHYGEQLQREKDMRARRQRLQEQEKENLNKWKEGRQLDLTMIVLMTMAGVLFVNLSIS
ncbi:dnaJ (Hsp40) homolog, subfamily C, member 30b [Gymnodraco acuticeps]|uniref:DnaJ (Hsp40) homolog, subfamily C, member 30b n=1 Tax=Gymnodraco acuticeps TaxID=8218 RepID=A0A6P8VGH2_GYMAC|nr:dnaJ (Hsp40) homolog, subfamily C, member 30b [Gymnodraco acuticeps]